MNPASPRLLTDTALPTLGDIMLSDVPVLSPSTHLVEALKLMERHQQGVALCVMPGQAPRALTQSACTELLMTSLQGFPVPALLMDAAQPLAFQMFKHQSVEEALSQLQGDLSAGIAVYEGDQIVGYVGAAQWSRLSVRLLQPAAALDLPADPHDLIDPLTALPDHRAYRMHLEMRLIDHHELNSAFSLALIEVDWLDGLVQRHSMKEERSTIQRVSHTLTSGLRGNDNLFSLEAGKWGLVMSDVSPSVGRAIAGRLIDSVWKAQFKNHGSPLGQVSISAGVTAPNVDTDSTESDAEEALEQALMSGGHQVRVMGERLI